MRPRSIDRQIPTILSYVDGDEYYGTQAKSFLVRNPKNTVAYFKDFLGQEYDVPTAAEEAYSGRASSNFS